MLTRRSVHFGIECSRFEEEKDEYLDQRVGKNEGKIFFFRSLPSHKSEKIIFILPTDQPIFLSRSACIPETLSGQ